MTLTPAEQAVVDDIAARGDELVALTSELIAFDTTAREPEDPPREEAALQALLGQRLGAAGASVDIWEPRHEDIADSRQMPRGSQIGFEGRPQLAARFAGAGGGRSLLFNGHIDAVSAEPKGRWTSDPFAAEVRDGLLYGRGACDMKGGVAAMTFAAEALVRGGVKLAGDLIVCTVTDEESSGIGGLAAVRHGVRADAGIVTEPTAFDVWVACRGTVYPTVSVPGRPGHAELHHPHWRDGGPVNAIEKGVVVLDAVSRMREDWEGRAAFRHDHLSPPTIIPTLMHAGEWSVTYPASCDITFGVLYIPAQSDPQGWGSLVEGEFERTVAAAAASDPWLAENPPTVTWSIDVPPMEIDPAHPIVGATLEASAAVGRGDGAITGLDSWYDGASFTLFGDTPSIAFGPRTIHVGHTIDEHVPVDDLVACAQTLAVAAMRYCGTV